MSATRLAPADRYHGLVPEEPSRPVRTRRARTVRGALAITLLGALVPGAGLLWARRWSGLLLLLPTLVGLGLVGFEYATRGLRPTLDRLFDPAYLRVAALAGAAATLVWGLSLLLTYLAVRPEPRSRWRAAGGALLAALLVLALASPAALAVRYAAVQADLVRTVFEGNETQTMPDIPGAVTAIDPWGGRDEVSVLLLGGDYGEGRVGVRTDTTILMHADIDTGDVTMFSLPRNMMNARFAPGSRLAELYPDGFRGDGDPAKWMLNAVYGQVPMLHPEVYAGSADQGADAIKEAVEGSLGIPVDYYALVNLAGFRSLVDAMGGVSVDVNEYVAIEGNESAGVPPEDYLRPGPDQHLDGYHALWFARGRYGSDDYSRMLRQRCLINDLIDEADPWTLLRRYQRLAAAGKEIVRSDIPASLLPAFVELGLRAKSGDVRSLAFINSPQFYSGDPDFEWLAQRVQRALDPPPEPAAPEGPVGPAAEAGDPEPKTEPEQADGEGSAVRVDDSCEYDPELAESQPVPYGLD